MNIGELKKALEGLDDNLEVHVVTTYSNEKLKIVGVYDTCQKVELEVEVDD